jgi:aminopeptidase YwaD
MKKIEFTLPAVTETDTFVVHSPSNFPAVVRHVVFLPLLLAAGLTYAQKIRKEDKALLSGLQTHISFLADDKLEGRRTGTDGERQAALYIAGQFLAAGLQPKGTDGFFQPFDVPEGLQVNAGTQLTIDDHALASGTDFFPLSFSANASLTALASPSLQESGAPWFLDLDEMLEANANNPHFDVAEAVQEKVGKMAAKGATAVFIYNTSAKADGLAFTGKEKSTLLSIPVVYLSKASVKKYLGDESATLDIRLKTDIGPKTRSGKNVVGFIDNGAATTVVLGAHFDHLGRGEDNNSMQRTGEPAIHNGADDNASGTAALIELARLLKASKLTASNYLFIAFSGEELGLFGSKHFVEHPTIDLASVSYMINMDMVGRLNDSSHAITVGGYGTTPLWGQIYALTGKKKMVSGDLHFRFDSSGTGPSDHTSFYNKNIPVLFYFTGLHSDYHRPTDDASRINYMGELQVVRHIYSLMETVAKLKTRPAFTKTRDAQMSTSARFSVTLGIMPDYTYAGNGVRVDGVSDGRPAQKAGLLTGDIITLLGDQKVTSVETYMQALGKFKKGDRTTVSYIRNNKPATASVEF